MEAMLNDIVKPQGRRWTTKEKAVALSIYKRSPKAYRLLQCFMSLPSRATLISMLSSVPFTAGICTTIFKHFWDRMENSISQWKFAGYRGGKPPSQKG
ncbi:hypothetical protein QE152_g12622 [Popillia japonica]|uniref:Uncharacterized protein n=1 Tax=Popillia japonica TaxID=7064 RepID=A0AAW1LNL6_POPJA